MKGTDAFTKTIQDFLLKQGLQDPLFMAKFQKEGKSINNCIQYILNTVEKSGCNGFDDDEIFGMAMHYYDEDKIDIRKNLNSRVVVNHMIELTEEEKNEAREQAKKRLVDQEIARMTTKKVKKTTPIATPIIPIDETESEEGDDSFDPDSFEEYKPNTVPKQDRGKVIPVQIIQGSLF